MKKPSLLCKSAILAITIVLLTVAINPIVCLGFSSVVSCDSSGTEKNTFLPSEDVYCKIWYPCLQPMDVRIYIVYHNEESWGGALTDRSDGYETVTIPSNPGGYLGPFKIWSNPLTPGGYDIVVDVNGNGIYDDGDMFMVDSGHGCFDVGFFVVPELPLGTLMAVMASMAAIGLAKNRLKVKQ